MIILLDQKTKAIQFFKKRKYPFLILKGLNTEQNFKDLCESLNFDWGSDPHLYAMFSSFLQF